MRYLLLIPLLLAPFPAAAHAILMASDPPVHGTVPPGPSHLLLRFNSRIDQGRSRIELRGGAGPVVLKLADSPGPDQLAADAVFAPGDWVLRWQVLAVDGHVTRGDVPFSVRTP